MQSHKGRAASPGDAPRGYRYLSVTAAPPRNLQLVEIAVGLLNPIYVRAVRSWFWLMSLGLGGFQRWCKPSSLQVEGSEDGEGFDLGEVVTSASESTAAAQTPTQGEPPFCYQLLEKPGCPGLVATLGGSWVSMASGKRHEFPPKLKTAHLRPCRREPSDPPRGCFAIVNTHFWKTVTASVTPELFIAVKYTACLLLHLEKLVCTKAAGSFEGVQVYDSTHFYFLMNYFPWLPLTSTVYFCRCNDTGQWSSEEISQQDARCWSRISAAVGIALMPLEVARCCHCCIHTIMQNCLNWTKRQNLELCN